MTEEANKAPQIEKQAAPVVLQIDKMDQILEHAVSMMVPNQHRNTYNTEFPFMIVPDGIKVLDIEKHMPHPSRTRKHVKFTDADSFIAYVNTFKAGHNPQLFVLKTEYGLSMMCVFDYDNAGDAEKNTIGLPEWNTHVAQLDLTYSLDYAELRKKNAQWFEQEEFALFVEENTHLFRKPDGSFMYELAQDLKVRIDATFRASRRLANGQVALSYVETVNGTSQQSGEEVIVPTELELFCSIFEGLEAEPIKAAFRFRKDGQAAEFQYKLMTRLQERAAHEAVRAKVAEAVSLTPLSVSTFTTNGSGR